MFDGIMDIVSIVYSDDRVYVVYSIDHIEVFFAKLAKLQTIYSMTNYTIIF
jgi:hypothetical protein